VTEISDCSVGRDGSRDQWTTEQVRNLCCYTFHLTAVADPGENPAMAPIQFGYILWPPPTKK